ncbi:MAG: hypothetical protein WCT26_03835 [Candidatus Buchananbacteria bacterium]
MDKTVRLVTLQIECTNLDAFPASVKQLELEQESERMVRESRPVSGKLIIEPLENCSLSYILEELQAAGYELVDASYQERFDPKDVRRQRVYGMVKFIFCRGEFVRREQMNDIMLDTNYLELAKMCSVANWRVRAYSNPLFENGQIVPGQSVIGINCDARVPLFQSDGKPMTKWLKDENGYRVGEKSVPIEADFELRIVDNCILLKEKETAVVA